MPRLLITAAAAIAVILIPGSMIAIALFACIRAYVKRKNKT